jgi:hypothetical protein
LRRFAHFLCPTHLTEHGAKLYHAYLRHIGPAQTDMVVRSRDAEGSEPRKPRAENFLERRKAEVQLRRKTLPGTPVNKDRKKGRSLPK